MTLSEVSDKSDNVLMTFETLLELVCSENTPDLCVDSRLVKAGDIFIAIKGGDYDGHDFIEQSVQNGARYILCERPGNCNQAQTIVVDDSAQAAALLAQVSRGNPASQLINLAVTGTNGKTTVAFLVHSIIQSTNQKCGLIGTIIYDTCHGTSEANLTTPDCLAIADMTGQMVEADAKYMVIEASSHALQQKRLAGINFKAAAFTNLTGDHLDYHKTEEDYLAAKAKLFRDLPSDATAVLNKQSEAARKIAGQTNAEILWYAVDEPADLTAHTESIDINGTGFVAEYAGQRQKIETPLPGRHNVSNCLAAAGLCLAAGFDLPSIAAGISALKTIPGRLEKVDGPQDFTVLIDYAHTDDALKNVLTTLKPLCKGRLTVVFGCGGDRDRTKRPRMAKVAEQLADLIIVTSDNPRTEHPAAIMGEIMVGFENPTADTITSKIDRKKAIELTIKQAEKDDIVLIAGKGHETYQIIGKQKFDFSDFEIARKCLKK